MGKEVGAAASQNSETISSIIHKVKVLAHLEVVDKPCWVLELIGPELFVRCIVHL